jgi:hypothetical protein
MLKFQVAQANLLNDPAAMKAYRRHFRRKKSQRKWLAVYAKFRRDPKNEKIDQYLREFPAGSRRLQMSAGERGEPGGEARYVAELEDVLRGFAKKQKQKHSQLDSFGNPARWDINKDEPRIKPWARRLAAAERRQKPPADGAAERRVQQPFHNWARRRPPAPRRREQRPNPPAGGAAAHEGHVPDHIRWAAEAARRRRKQKLGAAQVHRKQ